MEPTLQHLIYGKKPTDQPDVSYGLTTLAHTADLSVQDGTLLRNATLLEPFPSLVGAESHTVAVISRDMSMIVAQPERQYIVAGAEFKASDPPTPLYHYVVLSGTLMREMGAEIDSLRRLVQYPIDEPQTPALDLIAPPTNITWTLEKRTRYLRELFALLPDADHQIALGLLGAALHERRLLIQNFPQNLNQRLTLIQGLMSLLPQPARGLMTFTTHTATLPAANEGPVIVFSDAEGDCPRWVIDWHDLTTMPDALLNIPYVAYLSGLWTDDVLAFATGLRELEPIAAALMPALPLLDGLALVTKRHNQDRVVMTDDDMTADDLINVLQSALPPQGNLRVRYVERLLLHTLRERDTATAALVARELDDHPELDAQLTAVIDNVLDAQPDEVYVFVRARLAEGITDKWLTRLKQAAEHSLEVAISTGDPDTIISWLRLISREPSRYELGDVLVNGLLNAQTRATESADLARELITLAVKRAPELLDTLLTNPDVLAPLPAELRAVIEDYDPVAIETVANTSREIFLMALRRAYDHEIQCISPVSARELWEIYEQNSAIVVAEPYRPLTLIELLAAEPSAALLPGTHETLLVLIIAGEQDDLFDTIAHQLAASDQLMPVLTAVTLQSRRPADDILTLIGNLTTDGALEPQAAVGLYIELLDDRGWNTETLVIIEQVARLLNQNPDVSVSTSTLWKMLDLAAETRSELLIRAALRRLLADTAAIVVEDTLVENLQRLRKATNWNNTAKGLVLNWWRGYINDQSMPTLQKVSRAMDGKKSLDDLIDVVSTTIAVRRLLGTRTLKDFSAQIAASLSILQAISDGFEPDSNKQPVSIDVPTLRFLLDERSDDMTPDVAHVLATNLKELAQLIRTLAENRTKPSLIRSDDTVERQLYTGDYVPQSGLDIMKWLSGYLDGTHTVDTPDDDEV